MRPLAWPRGQVVLGAYGRHRTSSPVNVGEIAGLEGSGEAIGRCSIEVESRFFAAERPRAVPRPDPQLIGLVKWTRI